MKMNNNNKIKIKLNSSSNKIMKTIIINNDQLTKHLQN